MTSIEPRRARNKGLRGVMALYRYTPVDLAKVIRCSVSRINTCMSGRYSWSMDEMCAICDWLGRPYEDIPQLFDCSRGYVPKRR